MKSLFLFSILIIVMFSSSDLLVSGKTETNIYIPGNPTFVSVSKPVNGTILYSIINDRNELYIGEQNDFNFNSNIILQIKTAQVYHQDINFSSINSIKDYNNNIVIFIRELFPINNSDLFGGHLLHYTNNSLINRLDFVIESNKTIESLFLLNNNAYFTYQNHSSVKIAQYNLETNQLEEKFDINSFLGYDFGISSLVDIDSSILGLVILGVAQYSDYNASSSYFILDQQGDKLIVKDWALYEPGMIHRVSISIDRFLLYGENGIIIYGNLQDFTTENFDVKNDVQQIRLLKNDKFLILTNYSIEQWSIESTGLELTLMTDFSSGNLKLMTVLYTDFAGFVSFGYIIYSNEIHIYFMNAGEFISTIGHGVYSSFTSSSTSSIDFWLSPPIIFELVILLLLISVFVYFYKKGALKRKDKGTPFIHDEQPRGDKLQKEEIQELSQRSYCPNCNFELQDGDLFCFNCGKKLT